MELKKDAMIVTHDGQEVGHLDRVALNPRSKAVTHLVVRKGTLFPVDRVIEMSYVGEVTPDRITLRPEVGDPKYLPPFEVKHYVSTNEPEPARGGLGRLYAPKGYWTTPAGDALGVPIRGVPDSALPTPRLPKSGEALEVERNVPETTVALKEGARVVSEDDVQIGKIVRIVTNEATGQATQFVVVSGSEEKRIPADWIGDVKEKEVRLLVPAGVVSQVNA